MEEKRNGRGKARGTEAEQNKDITFQEGVTSTAVIMQARIIEQKMFRISGSNINGVTLRTSIGMLAGFLQGRDIDVMFVQEITQSVPDNTRGYNSYTNLGTTCREVCTHTINRVSKN
jgi:hypothetical protein